jgi:hypothetical protein
MEIYVDEKGIAHDDEGNSWYCGKPEGDYSHRDFDQGFAKAARHIRNRDRSKKVLKEPKKD